MQSRLRTGTLHCGLFRIAARTTSDQGRTPGLRGGGAALVSANMAKGMNVGEWVEVRPEAEILRTLDEHGQLDGMPFMPEMLRFCGQKFQIYKRAHKTCDSVARQSRQIERAVHLQTRCSGDDHGGCQAGCLLFWKEAWLRPLESREGAGSIPREGNQEYSRSPSSCTKGDLLGHTSVREGESVRYLCQITQIRSASTPLRWWELRQYLEDFRSGNVGLWRIVCGAATAICLALGHAGMGIGHVVRWAHDHLHFRWRGRPFPRRVGTIPRGQRTPLAVLNLQPGELVRVRSIKEIEQTLDTAGQNRGLYFDPEQVPYVNRTFRVAFRVERIISEETGQMIELKTPSVALESVVCQGRYSACRMFCPKSSFVLWREGWLERR